MNWKDYKMSKFHLISCYGNFVKEYSFRSISGELLKSLRRLSVFTKFSHQELSEITESYAVKEAMKLMI